jgi:xylulokinase
MVSSDVRAAAIAREWPDTFGADRLYQVTGHTAHPMFTLFKLLWLRQHAPEVWNGAARFLCFEDMLTARLGIPPAMGWPLAGRTMLFDVRRHEWSGEILDAVGLSPDRLARPLQSGSVSGTVASETARALGLAPDAIVVTGGHDQTCGALGAGITRPGMAMYATGTVECITPAFARPVFTPELRRSNLCTYDHAAPGLYATVAFCLTGGNILKWFRDQFGADEVRRADAEGGNAYELLLEAASPTPSPLMVLPYFTPSGTPYFDTTTRGAIVGLSMATTRGEILRAMLEGVALEMRLNLDILERSGCHVRELRAIGGGARSAFWTQLKADVIGKPVTALHESEAGCLGAAMLAFAADTESSVLALADSWVQPAQTFHPDPDRIDFYVRRFGDYVRLYPAIRELNAGAARRGNAQ